MAAQPPRPSARNAGARAGPGAPPGAGAARAGPSHPSPNSGLGSGSSGTSTKGDKTPGTFFLGRYRVVEEIGIGGMASVHLARMDGPGGFQKWVAIKRIHPNLVEDDQFVDMFLDEARIAAGINHANVAQVFDLGKDEGTYWIAMEYLHGEPLRELMRRCEERQTAISCDVAARVCADAAEGLHAAHELRGKNNNLLGLVHRDVTPHNLFITYEGYTKVVDFGIAKVADRLSETRAGTLKGKLAYMSPEQVRGQDDVDRTTDIFALGVVLWELTTGHRLFRMDTDLDTLEKVQACVVPPPSTIVPGYPIELESVVMKALAKKKPERYQTARELSRALQLYLQRRAVLIGPEEVSAFVREMFADRIKAREAHLAWAADVTSTINIDQLNAMKAGRSPARDEPRITEGRKGEEISLKSLSDSSDGGPRTMAMSADHGKPSVPGSALPPIRPSTNGVADPNNFGAPHSSRRPAPPPPPTVPNSPAAKSGTYGTGPMAAVGPSGLPNPNAPNPNAPRAMTSLVDDDEDIPTTVATHAQVHGLQGPGNPTSLGRPGIADPANLPRPPPNHGAPNQGGGFASIRATTMGLGGVSDLPRAESHQSRPDLSQLPDRGFGSTIALAPGQAPTFGPPPATGSQPGFAPPNFGQPEGMQHPHARTVGMPGQQQQGPANQYYQNNYQTGPQPPVQPGHSGAFAPPPGMYQQGFGPPSHQGSNQQHGTFPPPAANGVMQNGLAHHGGHRPPPPSAIETALSLPRPEPNPAWTVPANVKHSDRMSTAVLIAVAVLTAICVLALGALIYFRYRAAPSAPVGGAPIESTIIVRRG